MNQRSLTQYPLKIQPAYGDQTLAHATGLLCNPQDRIMLVTNWHVVSGKDAFTGKLLNKQKPMPTSLRVNVALCKVERELVETTPNGSKEKEHRVPLLKPHLIEVPLYENGVPKWREHPTLGRVCDVVALDIDAEYRSLRSSLNPTRQDTVRGTVYEPFSTCCNHRNDMRGLFKNTESFDLDSEAMVIGFPHLPVTPPPVIPMAKNGTVASPPSTELYFDERRLPAFYLDVLTRPGFSGSPVFWRSTGVLFEKTSECTMNLSNLDVGPRYSFVGIYSSRINEPQTKEPMFGVCWTKDAIESVCGNDAAPENPAIETPASA